jgi:hypothetical protein
MLNVPILIYYLKPINKTMSSIEPEEHLVCETCNGTKQIKCRTKIDRVSGYGPTCHGMTQCPDCTEKMYSCEKCKYDCNYEEMASIHIPNDWRCDDVEEAELLLEMCGNYKCCADLCECDCTKKYVLDIQFGLVEDRHIKVNDFENLIRTEFTSLEIPTDHNDSIKKVLSMIVSIHTESLQSYCSADYITYDDIIQYMMEKKL